MPYHDVDYTCPQFVLPSLHIPDCPGPVLHLTCPWQEPPGSHCQIPYCSTAVHITWESILTYCIRTKAKSYIMQTTFRRKILFAVWTATCHLTTSVLCGRRVTPQQRELIMIWLYCMALLTALCRDTWKHVTNLDLYLCLLHRKVSLNQTKAELWTRPMRTVLTLS